MHRNGTAFDRAVVDMQGLDTLVLPSSTKVVRRDPSDSDRSVVLEIEKTLGFHGHTSDSHSIDEDRERMGCAVSAQEGKLHIATVGGWDSGIEGGRSVSFSAMIPHDLKVERTDEFVHKHPDQGPSGSPLKRRESDGAYVAEGSDRVWKRISDEPNPAARRAKLYEKEEVLISR